MKKIFSLILAIIMIITAVPVAFAAECEHVFDAGTADRYSYTFICGACGETVDYEPADYSYVEALFAYDPSVNLYTTDEYAQAAAEDFDAIFYELLEEYPEGLSIYEQDKVDEYARKVEAQYRKFSESLSSGKYGIAIDAALLLLIMAKYDTFVANHEPLEDYFSPETLHKIKVIQREEFYYLTVIYQEQSMDPSSITAEKLAEFEGRLKTADDMVSSMYSCTAGQHNFGEDLACEFCGEMKVIEECEDCGRKHLKDIDKYLCPVIMLIKLLVSLFESLK